MNPINKIKEIREKEHLSQQDFADKYKLKLNTVRFIEQDRTEIPKELAIQLEAEYGIPFKWWMTGKGSTEIIQQTESNCIELPLITASAGGGYSQLDNEIILVDKSQFEELGFRTFDRFVGCKISGDSMQPYINDGDLLIVDTNCEVTDGRIYIINAFGDLFCKKIRKGISYFIMESVNPNYPEEKFNRDEMTGINIIGQVVTVIRKVRI